MFRNPSPNGSIQHLMGSPGVNRAQQLAQLLETKLTKAGKTLAELSLLQPTLVVFLRQPGCTFCRESLDDIATTRSKIESNGTQIVLVHHGDQSAIDELITAHKLEDLDQIHDLDQSLYQAFGLQRGSLRQVAGPKVWFRAAFAGRLRRFGLGKVSGDPLQMPGVFLIHNCGLVKAYRHQSAADRPDYVLLGAG